MTHDALEYIQPWHRQRPNVYVLTGQLPLRTHYQELQENEVMVLQAIYGDDFIEHKSGHSAWQVRSRTDKPNVPVSVAYAVAEIRTCL